MILTCGNAWALSLPAKVNADLFNVTQYPGVQIGVCHDNGATLAGITQLSSMLPNQVMTIADTNGGVQATPLTCRSNRLMLLIFGCLNAIQLSEPVAITMRELSITLWAAESYSQCKMEISVAALLL